MLACFNVNLYEPFAIVMNPYAPSDSHAGDENPAAKNPVAANKSRRLWPLLLMNLAFLLCAVSVVVLPGLGAWLLVSVLVVFSIGGWTLVRSLRQQ